MEDLPKNLSDCPCYLGIVALIKFCTNADKINMVDKIIKFVLFIFGGFILWMGSTGTLETIPNLGILTGTLILCYLSYEWGKGEKGE